MYEVKKDSNISSYDCIIYQSRNSENQIVKLKFTIDEVKYFPERITYFVTFQIMSKRKHGFQDNTSTGKDGIKSLVWAKKCIKHFIENELRPGDKVVVQGSDSKRLRVYKKGLKDLNFYQELYANKLSLVYRKK